MCLLLVALITQPAGKAQQHNFFAYGEGSGLSNLNATTLLQDRDGLLWAGTQSGIFTADGPRFDKQKAFTDAGFESIRAMREDSAGRIWVADGRHLGSWQNGVLQPIDELKFHVLTHEPLDLVVLPHQTDGVLFLRANNLSLVSSHDGGHTWQVANALGPNLLNSEPALKTLTGVTVDPQHSSILWLGCGGSVCKVDLSIQSVIRFDRFQGVASDRWNALMVTRSGDLWVRGDKNVAVLRRGSSTFEPVLNLPADCFHNIRRAVLSEDPSGKVLFNLSSGIAVGSPQGWHVFNESNGLPGDETDTIMFDRSGSLWLTSLGHGILRWRGYGDWEGWNKTAGLNNNIVWSLTRDGAKDLWIATDAGLAKLDISTNRITSQGSFTQRLFSTLIGPRHHVWIDDPTGQVLDFDPKTRRTRIAAGKLEHVFQMRIDSKQRIWAGSRKGLLFFSPADNWTLPHFVQAADGPTGYAWSIAEAPDGSIWVSTGKGIYRLKGDTWSEIHLPFADGIEYNRMVTLSPDGTFWMQNKLPHPILHLKLEGNNAKIIDEVSSANIGSDNTTFLETDQRGWVWVGSDDGVHVFNGNRWIMCTAEDGLIWNDTDFHAFFADPDGSVWIGTSAGISHLLHPEHLFAHTAPLIQLADVSLSGHVIATGGPSFDLRRPTLSFRFRNVNYESGSGVVAQYKLEGEENDWQETTGGLVRFPALNAGKYNLHIRAYDQRLHLSSPVIDVPFTVLEPWWRRRWSIAIEGALALLILFGLWRLNIHILVVRQQELERLVISRTHELETEKAELLTARSALLEITRRDGLTGLLNRTAIFERLNQLCEIARSNYQPIAIIMADLDSFKRVNDQYGHLVGDTVLRECASRIANVTRPTDAIGRYGGEELLILIPGLSVGSIKLRIEEIRRAIGEKAIRHGDLELSVTCSFGTAWFFGDDSSIETLIGGADAALYLAKQNGRNRIEYAELVSA